MKQQTACCTDPSLRKLTKVQGSDINSSVLPNGGPPPGDPDIEEVVQSAPAHDKRPFSASFNPSDLIGRTFLTNEDDGTRRTGKIIDHLDKFQKALEKNEDRTRFKVEVGEKVFEETWIFSPFMTLSTTQYRMTMELTIFDVLSVIGLRGSGKHINIFNC